MTAQERIRTLSERRAALISYLRMKTDEEDWHGVSDAANDLRVIESQLRELESVALGRITS